MQQQTLSNQQAFANRTVDAPDLNVLPEIFAKSQISHLKHAEIKC